MLWSQTTCSSTNFTNYLSWAQSALHDVRLLLDPLVVLQEPLKRRFVWVKLWLEVGLGEEPPFTAEERLRESGAVEVERDARARSGDAEAERRGVQRKRVWRPLVLAEELLPLDHVVVAKEVKRLWRCKTEGLNRNKS